MVSQRTARLRLCGALALCAALFQAALLLLRGVRTAPPARIAVVIPIVWCQVQSRLVVALQAWQKHPPCSDASALHARLSLVFYYNRDLEHVAELHGASGRAALMALWQSLGAVQRCFRGGVHFLSAHVPDRLNKYPTGTCVQFYRSFAVLRGMGFDHWMQLEPDVVPIRAGWGTRIAALAANNAGCIGFWQAGSYPLYEHTLDRHSRVDNGTSLDNHINGNSLYCLADAGFYSFLQRVQQATPHGCGDHPLMKGFDWAMYRFRTEAGNRRDMRFLNHKFAGAEFIANLGKEAVPPTVELPAHVLLVHAKSLFRDASQMAACRKEEHVAQRADSLQAVAVRAQPRGCAHPVFEELFERSEAQYDLTGEAQKPTDVAPPVVRLTANAKGQAGHIEFAPVYTVARFTSDFAFVVRLSAKPHVSRTSLADGVSLAFVDAAKHSTGAARFTAVSGVQVPEDALSIVVDEFDNGDGTGFLLVSSADGDAVVVARRDERPTGGLLKDWAAGATVQLRVTVSARGILRAELDGAVVFSRERVYLPPTFFVVVSANTGDRASMHTLHSAHACMTA